MANAGKLHRAGINQARTNVLDSQRRVGDSEAHDPFVPPTSPIYDQNTRPLNQPRAQTDWGLVKLGIGDNSGFGIGDRHVTLTTRCGCHSTIGFVTLVDMERRGESVGQVSRPAHLSICP